MGAGQGRQSPVDIDMADLGRLCRAVPDARMGHLDSRWLASIAKRSSTDGWGSLGTGIRSICPSLRRRSIHRRKEVMVVVREKTTVTQRIHGNCPTHSRTEIAVRDVRTVIDEPKEREGTNMGPTPTETMVAPLIASTNVITHKCAKKHRDELKANAI